MRSLLGPAVSDGIARIEIDRPGQLNALNAALRDDLDRAVAELIARDDVRVLVIAGSGTAAFVAGADVGELEMLDPSAAEALSLSIAAFHRRLSEAPFPVIAMVRGWCLGGGLELALASDIIVAADDAQFGLPEIKLGIIPGGGGLTRLTRAAGPAAARWLALTGQTIDARRALDIGLVAAIAPAAGIETFVSDLARRLARASPQAVRAMKRALSAAATGDFDQAIAAEARIGATCYGTADQRRLMRKFLERKSG